MTPEDQQRILRRRLQQQALAGDENAIAIVAGALPQPLPAKVVNQCRDREIRAAADWLRSTMLPSLSERQLAAVLVDAGDVIARGARQFRATSPAMVLAPADRIELLERLAPVVAWATRWPHERWIRTILAAESGQKIGRETAQASAA